MIGIMADSHDNLHAVKRAVELFKKMECYLVIHAGDFVAPFAARELESLPCPVKAVFGNCDGEKLGLKEAIRPFGEIKEAPLTLNHLNRNILVTHVHFSLKSYIVSRKYDILIFGHTHKPEIRRKKKHSSPKSRRDWRMGIRKKHSSYPGYKTSHCRNHNTLR